MASFSSRTLRFLLVVFVVFCLLLVVSCATVGSGGDQDDEAKRSEEVLKEKTDQLKKEADEKIERGKGRRRKHQSHGLNGPRTKSPDNNQSARSVLSLSLSCVVGFVKSRGLGFEHDDGKETLEQAQEQIRAAKERLESIASDMASKGTESTRRQRIRPREGGGKPESGRGKDQAGLADAERNEGRSKGEELPGDGHCRQCLRANPGEGERGSPAGERRCQLRLLSSHGEGQRGHSPS